MATGTIITIEFRDATLLAVERPEGIFIPLTPICDAIGIDAEKQRDRMRRDPILQEGLVLLPMPSAGGRQEMLCLRLDLVHGWLFSIDHERVRPEARDQLLAFKRECFSILFEQFYSRNRKGEHKAPSYREKIALVREARVTMGKEAAAQVWKELGLIHVPAMDALQGSLFPAGSKSAA
jgi:hypothetical protein